MRTQLHAKLQTKINEWIEENGISQERIQKDALSVEMANAAAAVFDVTNSVRETNTQDA